MKYFFILILALCVVACAHRNPLSDMSFQTISASPHVVASWYKITNFGEPLRVYIEGDGHAFTAAGVPSDNPTPHDEFLRELAANDPSPNVVYLGRPCQYLQVGCSETDWTSARFSETIVQEMEKAILTLMKKAGTDKVILIGYSGGAQIAGLVAVRHPEQVKHLITIAGVLDHKAWTEYHHVPALGESLNLKNYQKELKAIPQTHFVGEKDEIVPPKLVQDFTSGKNVVVVLKAKHNKGYDAEQIYEVGK